MYIGAPRPSQSNMFANSLASSTTTAGQKWKSNAAITAKDLSKRTKILSSDVFEGRDPSSRGGELTAKWLVEEMKRLRLQPGFTTADGKKTYRQDVPFISTQLNRDKSSFAFDLSKGDINSKLATDSVFFTSSAPGAPIQLSKSPIVFVGYGISDKSKNWDDYEGVDVKGKTVLIRGGAPQEIGTTLMARSNRKIQEAKNRGAASVILIHDEQALGAPWQAIEHAYGGKRVNIDNGAAPDKSPILGGWITSSLAAELVKNSSSKQTFDELLAASEKRGFKATQVEGASMSSSAQFDINRFKSPNIMGLVPGAEKPDEVVMYTAHWDHLGKDDALKSKDKIYNGAIDNAIGVAGVLEAAEAFSRNPKKPKRTVAVSLFTGEEYGLLGSQHFAENLPFPAGKVVGGINFDTIIPKGSSKDLVSLGYGQSTDMDKILSQALAKQKWGKGDKDYRIIKADPEPKLQRFFRSDNYSLAQLGIPVIAPLGGWTLVDGGEAAGKKTTEDYFKNQYHQPSDEWSKDWDLAGPVEDLKAIFETGNILANDTTLWPNWNEDTQFKTTRDKSRSVGM